MAGDNLFIVIEGLDGAGKTSIARQLHDTLAATYGADVALTCEPNDDCLAGPEIRAALAKQTQLSDIALAQAFALNRTHHLERVVLPFLARERRIVISDRYLLSSLVYQSGGALDMDAVYSLNRWARQPDLTMHLKISPSQAYKRMRQRPTERELFENNLARRAEKYQAGIDLLRAKGERIVEIDADGDFAAVFKLTLDALKSHGPAWLRIQPPLLVGMM